MSKPTLQNRARRIPTACMIILCTILFTALARAEDAPPASPTASPAAAAHAHKDKTIFEVLKEGGIVMIPLAAVSIFMVALIIDSIRRIKSKVACPPEIVNTLRMQFSAGDYQAAYRTCIGKPCFLTNVVRVGLSLIGQGKEVTEKGMEDIMAKEIANMNTRIYYLNLIGVVTPMIGLTGTVLGMMSAFKTLGTSGIGDPSALAGAIGEVLVATASGLFVAIPGFAFYYIFRNRIYAVASYTEEIVNGLFRGMPYEWAVGLVVGSETLYAAVPLERVPQQTEPEPVLMPVAEQA